MHVPEPVVAICRTLKAAGHEAWVVGGAVRDAILGREACDFDVATSALPWQVSELFPRVIETGVQHGTVTIMIGDEGFEVTTFRGEGAYSDGRRPDGIRFLSSVEEDLARRDFTVNAIAFDPISRDFCDPFQGREDLERRVLRAVGNPSLRFAEDGLRVMRAARFAATLGFRLESMTMAAIHGSLETFAKVSRERIRDELFKIMSAPEPSRAFRIMAETGMLEIVSPELDRMVGCEQNRWHAFDVWEHTLRVVDACPSDPVLRMGALFHDVGKPVVKSTHPKTGEPFFSGHEEVGAEMATEIAVRLRFSKGERERIVHLVRHHFVQFDPSWTDSAVRRWVRKVDLGNVSSVLTLARADVVGKGPAEAGLDASVFDELEARVSRLQSESALPTSTNSLAVNGQDIMNRLGIRPGPEVGRILAALLEAVTDDPEINTRDQLLQMATDLEH